MPEGFLNLISPKGMAMIGIALLLDVLGIICTLIGLVSAGAGEILSFIPDGIGILFFAILLSFKGQGRPREVVVETKEKIKMRKKVMGTIRKGLRGHWGKFGLAALGELTPFLGALPFWTIFAISELKNED